ncbi:UNVERIFIED_CONTAM: hypothetical protein HHA_450320 [Hammondia hammondi]|eukprot:XP_008889270.1 hypothetical protein HHA_450320 [Hammondia hammondi]
MHSSEEGAPPVVKLAKRKRPREKRLERTCMAEAMDETKNPVICEKTQGRRGEEEGEARQEAEKMEAKAPRILRANCSKRAGAFAEERRTVRGSRDTTAMLEILRERARKNRREAG